ncbi:unnamed protein product [Aphanomyces euteiches]|uniref:Transcriptional repressor Tup1 N-terminal domain-containing protein n=1 Tax=Aphanomyces euteiches TaxID=100861 RepID=A0A6G0XBW5_9STRA|nr:hypothetical protein Ae201684_006335 [Aphanomyces euteiches]KAH9090853.1 hypothetical protein Ae201684P_006257 [Aphanomyces euteiches]KAH9138754.1 hypothetical protein AeRB84_016950 [Aphanomyces euteiches]
MSSENNHLRVQYEALLKENKQLKGAVEKLEKENHDLKRSVFELSLKLDGSTKPNSITSGGTSGSASTEGPAVFNVNELLAKESNSDASSYLDTLVATGGDVEDEPSNNRIFSQKSELRGHGGAVYTTKFSPCGRLLASGSLDCRVLLWDVTTKFNPQQLASLGQHTQLVIDVSWSNDSRSLLSASYDHTVKLWDVEKAQLVNSVGVNGLVQTVSFNPADNDMYLIGTSQKNVHVLDTRSGVTHTWANDAMVNSLYMCPDGQTLMTGDSKGMIKTWDIRRNGCVDEMSHVNDEGHHAISHLHASPAGRQGDEDGRYLAVNSYDNILRVYDRGSKLLSNAQDPLQLSFFVTGHKNKNWPIKSSFFRGEGYNYKLSLPSTRYRKMTEGDGDEGGYPDREEKTSDVMLLATGSSDNRIYVHDVTTRRSSVNASLLQRIDAHTDRIYCVDFHPSEPILASASADFTVKIWIPRSSRLAKPS